MNYKTTEINNRQHLVDEAIDLLEALRDALDLMQIRVDLLGGIAYQLGRPISFATEAEESLVEAGDALRAATHTLWGDLSPHDRRLGDLRETLRAIQPLIEMDLIGQAGAA